MEKDISDFKEEKISVIVPVYKVENYLKKCLDSIIAQTYQNLEIILVDDGSPDKCPQICDDYAKKDNRIKVIHKQNGGLSDARNAAIEIFSGDYVTFVDSDDWVEPTYVEELYSSIKKYGCDISICGISRIDKNNEVFDILDYQHFDGDLYKTDLYNLFFRENPVDLAAWAKLYKREIFESIRYPVGLICEDIYIISDICEKVEKGSGGGVCLLKKPLYNYLCQRNGSISNNLKSKPFDIIYAYKRCIGKVPTKLEAYKNVCVTLFYKYNDFYFMFEDDSKMQSKIAQMFNEDYDKLKKYLRVKSRIRFFIFRHFKKLYKLIMRH